MFSKMNVFKSKQSLPITLTILSVFVIFILGSEPEIDLTKEPGHLQKFGTGRPIHQVDEVVGFPDPETFFRDYYIPQKPLKFKTAAKLSPAFHIWTDEYFLNLEIPKLSTIHLETVKKENRKQETVEMGFKEFVKMYHNSSYYMVDTIPPFLSRDVVLPCCLQCPDIMEGQLVENMMWFSSGGTNSVVHHDSVENINCVYRGSKDFVIVDPITYDGLVAIDRPEGAYSDIDVDRMDYVKYPGLAKVEYIHTHLEPGDCLYIPYKWIHQVRSYNSNLAVNIWWNHYDALKTDISKCNKECDKTLTLEHVKTSGFDSLIESVETLKDHILTGLKSAKDKTMSHNDFFAYIFPELMEHEGDDFIKEELDVIKGKGKELVKVIDANEDGFLTFQEADKLSSYKLVKVGEILIEVGKAHKAMDEKFGYDDDLQDIDGEEGIGDGEEEGIEEDWGEHEEL